MSTNDTARELVSKAADLERANKAAIDVLGKEQLDCQSRAILAVLKDNQAMIGLLKGFLAGHCIKNAMNVDPALATIAAGISPIVYEHMDTLDYTFPHAVAQMAKQIYDALQGEV